MAAFRTVLTALLIAVWSQWAQAQQLTLPLTSMEQGITTFFVSPDGAGDLSGSSEANALPLSQLDSFIRELTQSARIQLLSGDYPITKGLNLAVTKPDQILVLEGKDNVVLQGNFNPVGMEGISTGLRLHSGNIIVRNIRFKKTGFCIKADKNATLDQVLIEDIAAEDVHTCILVEKDVTLPVTRWIIRDALIDGYYRSGIRLSGPQTSNILIDSVQIDGENQLSGSDCYKAGIQLLAGAHDIHISTTSIKNNIGDCGEQYQQGDGIEADHKNGTPRNIRLENVLVANSGDADLDLKADNVSMYRVAALGGPLTRHSFKLWEYDQYSCKQCYAFGANAAFVLLSKATFTLKSALFTHDQPIHICDLRHGTTPEQKSTIHFERSRIYVGNEEWINECGDGVLADAERIPAGRIAPPQPPEF